MYKSNISSFITKSTFFWVIQPHIHALSVYLLDFSAIFVGMNLTVSQPVDFIFVSIV